MAYQFPYIKIIRDNGEIIPNSDHNKQENQIEKLTDAVGNYDFTAGSIEARIQNVNSDIADTQADLTVVSNRVTVLETAPEPNLGDLSDVTLAAPANGNVLTYNSGTGEWENQIPVRALNDLSDVNTAGATVSDSLSWNGVAWVPLNDRISVYSGLSGAPGEASATLVDEIRFVTQDTQGEDHYVTQDGTTAYVGGGSPPSGLGGNIDGLTNLVIGRMSQSNVNYPPTLVQGDIYSSITQDSSFTLEPETTSGSTPRTFGSASLGNLILEINGIDVANIDLAANFVEGDRNIGQVISGYNTTGTGDAIAAGVVTFAGGTLSILSVEPNILPIDEFQVGTLRVTVTSAALRIGYNSLRVRHEFGVTTNQTNLLEWFYDQDPDGPANDPSISSLTLAENTPVLNYLSGVPYYDTGSTFDLDATLLRAFNNVYHQSNAPIELSSTWDSNTSILVTDPSVAGVSTPPDIGETMTVNNFALTVNSGIQDNDATVDGTPVDPHGSYTTVGSTSANFAIMSNGPNSTETFEDFTDERYRLPNTTNFDVIVPFGSAAPDLFDSTISLLNVTRNNELQVYDFEESAVQNRLRWPSFDYSNALNFQPQAAPDYSSLAVGADRTYYRVFRGSSDQTNGVLTFPGLSESDIIPSTGNPDIVLRIKVPGKTVWLDLAVDFNPGTFTANAPLGSSGLDGEGCRINSGVNNLDLNGSIEFSLGTIGTDITSDYQLILEVTYANSTTSEILGSGSGLSINW